jgi:hypothetical protein
MKLRYLFLLFLSLSKTGIAQEIDSARVYRIGIFANLFLDSSFTNSKYRFNNQMPRHILPGLDFAEGSLMAFDSLMVQQKVNAYFFDLRSQEQSITNLRQKNIFDSLDLMIGAVAGVEYRQLADIAFQKNIPFISSTFPNDGGVTNNPYTIIINSTLPVHCEAIYNYLLRSNPTSNIVYIRKKGQQEDRLAGYFNNYNKTSSGGSLLKWKTLNITDSVKVNELAANLDSTSANIVICGSLDEKFGTQVIAACHQLKKKYDLQITGMPTWESMKELNNPDWKELTIIYSTTYYNTASQFANNFTKSFTEKSFGRPSDLAYKGFEITWNFVNLLLKHDKRMMQNLTDKTFKVFTDFDFRAVINKTSGKADYIENKRIFILKRTNGLISRMN